jgi:hypothetical protein
MRHAIIVSLFALSATAIFGNAQETTISVHADQVLHRVTPYLTGACIEDVNHEIYGGIDSQIIFGESFAEPPPQAPLKGFKAYGGRWTPIADGSLESAGGEGPKLVCDGPEFEEGQASVDLMFNRADEGNAGLIVKVSQADNGADRFIGYEVALRPSGTLVLSRHRQNWEAIRNVPCDVSLNQWVTLSVRMKAKTLEILVNGRSMLEYQDTEHPLIRGVVGLRNWHMGARFRKLAVTLDGERKDIPLVRSGQEQSGEVVSGMWRALRRGSAEGKFSIKEQGAFSGHQYQEITFTSGTGEIGIENQSLNRWGMNFVKEKPYEGYIWARAAAPTKVFVSLESKDGATVYSEKSLKLDAGDWKRLTFALKPNAGDKCGRFAIKIKQPGTIMVGYAFLQPGAWGRFKNLPVRKDVAEGLINLGVTMLRYGGSMVNAPDYRWKKMIGPRDRRPPYKGTWYPYSSNGWGIFDFLNLCEAAGFLPVPDLNADETPQDMSDFIEYVNGPADSEWGRKRVADGHSKPYQLKYVEIGNEETVNDIYYEKFKSIAEAIWTKDPAITLVVGDFAYHKKIEDPFNFPGADGHITSLAAHQKILRLVKEHGREVWFDVHVWTDGPAPDSTLPGMFSFYDALDELADGAKHKVVVFELNANNHSQRRALANALALNAIQRDGRLPLTSSANCLQPDGQNDNGWDQGLLFLNPSQVWFQPPGFVNRMISQNHQPLVVKADVQNFGPARLDVSATESMDGKSLILQVVNAGTATIATLNFTGFTPRTTVPKMQMLAAPLDARNTAGNPDSIKPSLAEWKHVKNERMVWTFPSHSITVIRF